MENREEKKKHFFTRGKKQEASKLRQNPFSVARLMTEL